MFKVSRIIPYWISLGCVLLAGCSSREVAKSDIVGIWVEKQVAGVSSHTGDCATFEFRDDGTFNANNLPREYFVARITPDLPRVQISGKWGIKKGGDIQYIGLYINDPNSEIFDSGKGYSTLYMAGNGAELTLYAWAHDENEQIDFVKRDTADCSD